MCCFRSLSAMAAVRKSFPLFTVDAFTKVPFQGNPAAVVLLNDASDLTEKHMQQIASEMNLSETAFVSPTDPAETSETGSSFGIRFFTPAMEVDLCGHATLASATVLLRCCRNTSKQLTFHSLCGPLLASGNEDGRILLNLPLQTPEPVERQQFEELIRVFTGNLPVQDVAHSGRAQKLLARLHDDVTREQLESMKPCFDKLDLNSVDNVKGVIVTLKGSKQNGCVNEDGQQYDFVSRYFSPWHGIPEDPVTGSAHTVLGPYWSKLLGKLSLFGRQASRRGGDVYVNILHEDRVEVGGYASVVVRGQLQV